MCTAITYKTKSHYFGRNLDLEYSYNESVTITPREYEIRFSEMGVLAKHYAIIGMAYVVDDYPLYYDATNEEGLSMAALNFVGNAIYRQSMVGQDNVAAYELIAWVLSQCKNVEEAKNLLSRINITANKFNEELPVAQLHFIISDREKSITLESLKEGIRIYDNPVGVLTNNPPFDYQMFNLNNYMSISKDKPINNFSKELMLEEYSRGMGAMGLPGDWSSLSRFVRATFAKLNSVSGDSEEDSVSQFFHILGTAEQPKGLVRMEENRYQFTIYSSCCNTDKGIYYYKTYDNSAIIAIDMHKENLDSKELINFKLVEKQQVFWQN
ncbi:MAG: choloylglycine hydrolase [Lachnospiraceae bacterium]|nr:choloylglycine hydrolase [Lachnospiraceae bacterium]